MISEAKTMLNKPKMRLVGCGILAALLMGGCSGDNPDPAATATATPSVTSTPDASTTPAATEESASADSPAPRISPLGGKPATEEEKEYYKLQKKAEDMVLSRNYKDAIPLLEQAHEQKPQDADNAFYLLLSHGSLEMVPSKGSAAYPYAKKVQELTPNTNKAQRAKAYLIGAELNIAKDFKYTDKTFYTYGGFVYDPKEPVKLKVDSQLHTEISPRLSPADKATLWEGEVAPKMIPPTLTLPKGTAVQIISEAHYWHSLTSWRKPLTGEPKEFDDSIFEVNAFLVEVVSDGESKGKKGWIVNQVDRYIDKPGDDPFGVWIPDRFGLLREAEAKAR